MNRADRIHSPHTPWYGACVCRARATLLSTLNKLFGRWWLDSNNSLVAFARDTAQHIDVKSSLTFYAPAVLPAPNYLQSSEHVPCVRASASVLLYTFFSPSRVPYMWIVSIGAPWWTQRTRTHTHAHTRKHFPSERLALGSTRLVG